MSRILHVANFRTTPKGGFLHKVEHKLSNGLIRNGHQVINWSDREAARRSGLFGQNSGLARRAANRALLALCSAMAPDVILLGHADIVTAETVTEIRARLPDARVLQWSVDPMFFTQNYENLVAKSAVVHATLVSTAGEALRPLARPGVLLGFLPNPVDYSIERGRNHERETLPADVFYACGNPGRPLREICGRDWRMDDFVKEVQARAPGLAWLTPGMLGAPNVGGARFQSALESAAVGLNISRRDDNYLYSSDRIAQCAGNGQAVVIARSTGYGELFGEDEMVFFDHLDGLAEALLRLKADPAGRMRLAARGRERYHALFNERIIARYVLEVARHEVSPADYPWPTLLAGA